VDPDVEYGNTSVDPDVGDGQRPVVAAVPEHRHSVGRRPYHQADVVDAEVAVRVDDVALEGVPGLRRRAVLEVRSADVQLARDVDEHGTAEKTRRIVDED